MALPDSALQRARELAALAPPPDPDLLSRLRAILTGCAAAQAAPAVTAQRDPDHTADAA
jgi:hypothetical protein